MKARIAPDDAAGRVVVETVSDFESRDSVALPPLTDVVDPDALEELCTYQADGTPEFEYVLCFAYSDSRVRIDAASDVTVTVTERKSSGE